MLILEDYLRQPTTNKTNQFRFTVWSINTIFMYVKPKTKDKDKLPIEHHIMIRVD